MSNLTSALPCPGGTMSTPGASGCVAAVVSTLAGGTQSGVADGIGTKAAFFNPSGVAVDAFGNVLVADSGNNRVRRVTPSGGTRPAEGKIGGQEIKCFWFLLYRVVLFFFQFSLCI